VESQNKVTDGPQLERERAESPELRTILLLLRVLHRSPGFHEAHGTGVVVVAATGNCPHTITGTPLPIEALQQFFFLRWRQASKVYTGQIGIKRLSFGRGSGPDCWPQNE